MTDGRDALRRVRLRNDNAREIDKLFPMNVPARGTGGALAYNFGPPEAAVTSDERNFTRRRSGSHEAAENGEGQRPRCLKWGGLS
ncbi:MAG: hypothetical protein IKR48_01870 [Kiritimatiellae bacterium]|nr:hypothetical protein [Kiritimatiellia bacterium]